MGWLVELTWVITEVMPGGRSSEASCIGRSSSSSS